MKNNDFNERDLLMGYEERDLGSPTHLKNGVYGLVLLFVISGLVVVVFSPLVRFLMAFVGLSF